MLREPYKHVNTRRWGSLEAIFYTKQKYKTRYIQRGLASIFVLSTFLSSPPQETTFIVFVFALSFHCFVLKNIRKYVPVLILSKHIPYYSAFLHLAFLQLAPSLTESPNSNTQRSSLLHFRASLNSVLQIHYNLNNILMVSSFINSSPTFGHLSCLYFSPLQIMLQQISLCIQVFLDVGLLSQTATDTDLLIKGMNSFYALFIYC